MAIDTLDTDVANLFVPELLDLDNNWLKPNPKNADQVAAEGAVSTLDPGMAVAPDSQVADSMTQLGKLGVQSELNVHVDAGTVDTDILGSLRNAYNLPTPSFAVAGAVAAVANPGEDVSHLTESKQRADARAIAGMAADLLAETEGDFRFTAARVGEDTDSIAGRLKGNAAVVGDTAANVLLSFPTQHAYNIIGRVFPEITAGVGGGNRLAIGPLVSQMQESVRSLPPEEAKAKLLALQKELWDESQKGMFKSDIEAHWIAQTLFGSLADLYDTEAPESAAITNKMTQAANWLEFVPVGSAAKTLMKNASRALGGAGRLWSSPTGFLRGSYNAVISKTEEGAKRMMELVRGRANAEPIAEVQGAATTEDVMDALALPKIDGRDLGSEPYILSTLVSEEDRARLLDDPSYVFGTLTNRINGAVASELDEGGVTMSAMFGTQNGRPFRDAARAAVANQNYFDNAGTVVPNPNGRGFFLGVSKSRQFGLEAFDNANRTEGNLTLPGYGVSKWLGKAMSTLGYGTESTNTAARQSEKVGKALQDFIEPYTSLPAGSQRRVAAVLDKGDELEILWDLSDLRNFGLVDKEIKAFAAVRKAADLQLDLDNVRLFNKYTQAGYRGLTVGNRLTGLKVLSSPDEAVAQMGMSRSAIRAVDLTTGSVLDLSRVPAGKQVARLMTPTATGERFAFVSPAQVRQLTDLPTNIIPKKAGFLPRPYKYPYYVKQFEGGAEVATLRPARSELEAKQLVDEILVNNPGADIRSVKAQEFRQVDDLDELESLDQAGLLWSSVRGPSRLYDAAGGVRLPTVEDRIRQMLNDGAMSAGLARWGDAQKVAWQAKYGSLFADTWTPGTPVAQLTARSGVSDINLMNQARREADFINNVLGVGKDGMQRATRTIGGWVADRFYNTATRLDKLRGGKKGSALANDLRDLGDQFIGANGRLMANAKTLPYMLYIAGNPIRQLPLQMTLIPSYFGVRGAAMYGLKGGFSKDFAALLAHGLTGYKGSNAELIEQFARSGIGASLDHHTMVATIGTTGTTSRASRFGSLVDGTTKALTNVGVGAGIRAEKVSAWLISRNRWMTDNPGKTIDRVAEQKIAAFAEELSLNPNRTDTLPIQHGILGFFTQFLSMQAKQVGRTLQALPGVGKAGNLSKSELRAMAVVNLATYGVEGYGLKRLADYIMNDPAMEDMPEEGRQILADGISNYVLDASLKAATGERTDTAFSESFSPNSQLGGTAEIVKWLVTDLPRGDFTALAESRWQAPGLGLASNITDAVTFTAAVAGAPPLPTPESDPIKLAAIAKKWASIMPAMNNWMKAKSAMEFRAKFNGRGDPLVEASAGEAIAAIAGVKTKEESRLWALNNVLTAANISEENAIPQIRDQANKTADWMLPLLDSYADGKISYQQALAYLDVHNAFMAEVFRDQPQYYGEYIMALRDKVDARWELKGDQIINRILEEAGSGRLPVDRDAISTIGNLIPDPDKRKLVTDRIKEVTFGAD